MEQQNLSSSTKNNQEKDEKEEEKLTQQSKNNVFNLLPSSFTKFINDNNIDKSFFQDLNFLSNLPRYIRIKPETHITKNQLESSLECTVTPVTFIENMYSIPDNIKIVNSQLYKDGVLYGIDLSSAAVVKSLFPQRGEHILDLCCCPGAKLSFIADLAGNGSKNIVGVDINQNRLNVCKNIITKYKLDTSVQLICQDGVEFTSEQLFDKVLVDAECTHDGSFKHILKYIKQQQQFNSPIQKHQEGEESGDENENQTKVEDQAKDKVKIQNQDLDQSKELSEKNEKGKQVSAQNNKKMSNRKLKRLKKQQQKQKQIQINNNKYFGSYNKKNEWTTEDFEQRFLDEQKLKNITSLQAKLLENGFKQLKPGGILVYSTCSNARSQNEDIVDKFLQDHLNQVQLIYVFEDNKFENVVYKQGFLEKTVRFNPYLSKSSGMFIAKIKKIKS